MGFNVFRDDWGRLESGELYLSDCTGLDRRLDRQLIEYIAIHGQGWWMPKFRRRYRIEETFPDTADQDDPGGCWRTYCMLKEQAAREDDRDVLKKAAFKYDGIGIGRFAFCRLTGYSWGDHDAEDIYTYWCGLKCDMLRDDIEEFCREMIEKDGPFAYEAKKWLIKLNDIPDETLDEWAEGQTERSPYTNLSDRAEKLLFPCDADIEISEEKWAGRFRSIFDAYIMMTYEERYGKISRSEKYRLMDLFTRDIYEILKQLNRRRITDETEAVIAILCIGRAMQDDITRDRIRDMVWKETEDDPQHSFFLNMAYRYGIESESAG